VLLLLLLLLLSLPWHLQLPHQQRAFLLRYLQLWECSGFGQPDLHLPFCGLLVQHQKLLLLPAGASTCPHGQTPVSMAGAAQQKQSFRVYDCNFKNKKK
jgi:hypothetical protein